MQVILASHVTSYLQLEASETWRHSNKLSISKSSSAIPRCPHDLDVDPSEKVVDDQRRERLVSHSRSPPCFRNGTKPFLQGEKVMCPAGEISPSYVM